MAGHPGFEKWRKANKSCDLSLLVADRHIIGLNSTGLEPDAVHQWAGRMKVDQLAATQ